MNNKYFTNIINISGLMGLGVFIAVGGGILLDKKESNVIDWRDLAMLGVAGSWITSWALFRERY